MTIEEIIIKDAKTCGVQFLSARRVSSREFDRLYTYWRPHKTGEIPGHYPGETYCWEAIGEDEQSAELVYTITY